MQRRARGALTPLLLTAARPPALAVGRGRRREALGWGAARTCQAAGSRQGPAGPGPGGIGARRDRGPAGSGPGGIGPLPVACWRGHPRRAPDNCILASQWLQGMYVALLIPLVPDLLAKPRVWRMKLGAG